MDGEISVISIEAVRELSRARHQPLTEVEVMALEQGIVPQRYLRNIGTIGTEGQIRLLRSHVAVVGAGGLGGTIIELLARQGVGHITIIDDDHFAEQNLNRQLLCTEGNIGRYKARVAAARVRRINSAVRVTVHTERLTVDNASRLLRGAGVVLDGLDNLLSRLAVEKACRELKIPFVHGSIAGFCGQLMTVYPEDPGLQAIYSATSPPETGIETRLGNPATTPAIIAALEVQEAIKIITGIGEPVRNRLLIFDLLTGEVHSINIGR
jgi:molybdopterin/thiamine biosynthesis adenylyltransferase